MANGKTIYFCEYPSNKHAYQGRRFKMAPTSERNQFAVSVKSESGEWTRLGTMERYRGSVQHFSGKNVWCLGTTHPWQYRARADAAGTPIARHVGSVRAAAVKALLKAAGLPEHVAA